MYKVEITYNCSTKSVSYFLDEDAAYVCYMQHPNAMFRRMGKISFFEYLKHVMD